MWVTAHALVIDEGGGAFVQAFGATWGSDGVLYLEGELDLAAEEAAVRALIDRPERENDLVIDMSRLTFMDSTGIRVLETVAMGPAAVRVVLRSPRRGVQRVLELVGIVNWPNIAVRDGESADLREDLFIF
jgi:anti-anti-sigma factor